jgi:hypothetical protein
MQKIFTLDYIEVLSNPLQNNTALVEHEKGNNSQWAPKRHDSLGMLICTIEDHRAISGPCHGLMP